MTDGAGVVPNEAGATDPNADGNGVDVTPNVFPNEGAGVEPTLKGFVTRAGVDDPFPKAGGAGVDPA